MDSVPFVFLTSNAMIYKEQLMSANDPAIKNAIELIHYGLGSRYDLQVMFGKMGEDYFSAIEKQGANLVEVNKLRESVKLHPINPPMNFKVVKKNWKGGLIDGTGLVFCIQSKQYKHKTNRDIDNALEWFKQIKPMFKIERLEAPKYDLFFIHLKKEKQESTPDETPVQIPDPTL